MMGRLMVTQQSPSRYIHVADKGTCGECRVVDVTVCWGHAIKRASDYYAIPTHSSCTPSPPAPRLPSGG